MNTPKLFEVLGKYAGLGGFSVGLVLLIFTQVLRSAKSKEELNSSQSYFLLRLALILTFCTGLLGISAWATINSSWFRSQPTMQITGHVAEKDTKRGLMGAEISLDGRLENTTTNRFGNFVLPITSSPRLTGQANLYIAMNGFAVWDQKVSPGDNIEVELAPPLVQKESASTIISTSPPHAAVRPPPKGMDRSPSLNSPVVQEAQSAFEIGKAYFSLKKGISSGDPVIVSQATASLRSILSAVGSSPDPSASPETLLEGLKEAMGEANSDDVKLKQLNEAIQKAFNKGQ